MSDLIGHAQFTLNELKVIQTALEAQIDDCNDYLTEMKLSFTEKAKLNSVINYSKSAIEKLNIILESTT